MKHSDPETPLRKNVRLLGDILGDTLKQQVGDELYQKIETIRRLSKEAHEGQEASLQALHAILQSLQPDEMLGVVRAFSHFLNLANIAENVHRVRRTKWHDRHELSSPQPGSIESTFNALCLKKISKKTLFESVKSIEIDLVLTAHPTEVTRRTLMQKFDRISDLLNEMDNKSLTPHERQDKEKKLRLEMTAIWQTDEVRRRRPTPIDEAKWGFAVVETSLWHALPQFLRNLDSQLKEKTGQGLELTSAPIRFSSWMGGDRDGNPNVTASLTEEICYLARWMACDLYLRDLNNLSASLSMNRCSEAIRAIVGDVAEPYRAMLHRIRDKCLTTKQWLEDKIAQKSTSSEETLKSKDDLLQPLLLCHQSLIENKAESIANGELSDLIRRVSAFGLTLLPLDVRQNASCHADLLDEVTLFLGLGSYKSWSESKRQEFLEKELQSKRPLIPKEMQWSEASSEVWKTFEMMRRQLPDSFGAYVISMTKNPSDVLLVCLLQKEVGMEHFLRVVPLFETLDDLQSISSCLQALFSCTWYKNFIQDKQEIMIGYSDSGKDAGILAAGWAQYQAQEQCVMIAKQFGIKITLFHGRGGSVGRGGAPAHLAILSQAPGSVAGNLRVTEQGEVIRNKYGLPQRACRTLELYLSATLEATLLPPPLPKQEWRALMDLLAKNSFEAYSRAVKEDKEFMTYFQQATPVEEIGDLAIGSRPSRRKKELSLDSLRAIPWVFAWTQNRLILPAWLGVGEALISVYQSSDRGMLEEMSSVWPFFRSWLSLIEMVLTKADPAISAMYEARLVNPGLFPIGKDLRERFKVTVTVMQQVLKTTELLHSNPILLRTIRLREPYLYPLHILQAELLFRHRQKTSSEQRDPIRDALMVSISGIAAGMQNTG